VYVFEIIDSHLPGYVYLPARYLLTQRIDDGKYEYIEIDEDERLHLSNNTSTDRRDIHGPAAITRPSKYPLLCTDNVHCLHCLSWPSQAADWPTRHRNYGWPDSATLERVVNNGCDVVGVAHRQCREHKVMGEFQWRLSFSRAEIVQINSWMPVQQIAYHILRVFVKTERLTESVDNSEPAIMSNYHFKTLMLWACELKPRSWWTENLDLVRISAELLNTLSVSLNDTRCPHYFINNCNLLDTSLSDAAVTSKLMSIDETYLSMWLINNYIGRCAQLCPSYISRLFYDVTTGMKLQKAVSEIVRWRLDNSLSDKWKAVEFAEVSIPLHVCNVLLTARSCAYGMNELTKIDERFSFYFSALALLHVTYRISRNGLSDDLLDILSTVHGRNFSQCYSVFSICKTELNTSELVELLQKSAVEHLTTYRQRMARDFASVATIVTKDYEALYAYKHGDYQRCLQLTRENVRMLLYAVYMPCSVPTCREFIQFLDDDIVSLTALMLMVNRECSRFSDCTCISQLTLSLYLMTQCQLKLHHLVTSLAQTLDYIKVAQSTHPAYRTLDHLTLKLIDCKARRTSY